MDIQDLWKILEASNDKFSVFADEESFLQYNFSISDFLHVADNFLTDEEKLKLFDLKYIKRQSSNIKESVLNLIQKDDIKLKAILNEDITAGLEQYQIQDIINTLGTTGIIQIIENPEFIQKHNIQRIEIVNMIEKLNDKNKQELLLKNSYLLEELQLEPYLITKVIVSLENEDAKLEMIELYNLNEFLAFDVLTTFSDESKVEIITENKYKYNKFNLTKMISSLNLNSLIEFFRDKKDFLEKNNIKPHEIIRMFPKENQLELVSNLENMNLTLGEKKRILVTIDPKIKKDIDKSNFPPEYITALEMKRELENISTRHYNKIILDLNDDLEKYRDLDELIYLNPTELPRDEKDKIFELCAICPNIKIEDEIGLGTSTVEEYINAEAWIDSVLQKIDESWSDVQKLAFIDNALGKKISYCPDFDTEVFRAEDARALWKIIDSGHGVCNGISQVEKYILDSIGIESEIVSSGTHSFLKIINIEVENEDGTKSTGDTILDPTWNMTAHRFGARPKNFCKSYEEIRKADIGEDGVDEKCHQCNQYVEESMNVTFDLDDKSLRKIFTSIGVAEKDGSFPIKELIEQAEIIDGYKLKSDVAIKKQLELLESYYPKFATCLNSTMNILQGVSLNQKNLDFNKCVVNRVYEKDDDNKEPCLYIYADMQGVGKRFYIIDKETESFLEIPKKEFEKRFECYEEDMKKLDGLRPWENKAIEIEEDLNKGSGKVIAEDKEEI